MQEIMRLARPEIIAMQAYSSAGKENLQGHIRLNANENPYAQAIYNRYPEPQPKELQKVLSQLYQVTPEELLIVRGSDEGIDLLIRLFCVAQKDHILICPPTYGMYKISALIQGAGICEVPLQKEFGFTLNVNAILNAWQPTLKIIFICNPNNPTGNLFKTTEILNLCQALLGKAIIVIDEAYIEFTSQQSLSQHIKTNPNLVILRTLSKAYGLAGLRCGAVLANACIIDLLKKIIAPYPIPGAIIPCILQALNKIDLATLIKFIQEERDKLFLFLSAAENIQQVWPSETNFLLFATKDGCNLFKYCQEQGILLRNRDQEFNLKNCLRLTIGLPNENAKLMQVIKDAK